MKYFIVSWIEAMWKIPIQTKRIWINQGKECAVDATLTKTHQLVGREPSKDELKEILKYERKQ